MNAKKKTLFICVVFVVIFLIGYYYTGKQKEEMEKRYEMEKLFHEMIQQRWCFLGYPN